MWKRKTKGITRPAPVEIVVDGETCQAYPGESVATALLAAGISTFRRSPRGEFPRAAFCMMGSCQECVVWVDGRRKPACQTPVAAGSRIDTGTRANG